MASKRDFARDVAKAVEAAGWQRARAYHSGWAKDAGGTDYAGASGIHPGFKVAGAEGPAAIVYLVSERNYASAGYVTLIQWRERDRQAFKQLARKLHDAGYQTSILDYGREHRHGELAVRMPALRVIASPDTNKGQ